MADLLNDFLGRSSPQPSKSSGVSLGDFLSRRAEPLVPVASSVPSELEVSVLIDEDIVINPNALPPSGEIQGEFPIGLPTVQGWDLFSDRAGEVEGEVSQSNSLQPIHLAAVKVPLFNIPEVSKLIREMRLEEAVALFHDNRQAFADYLMVRDPSAPSGKADQLAKFISTYCDRIFLLDEFHNNIRRTLPEPTISINMSNQMDWMTISVNGSAPGANQLAVVSDIPLRFMVNDSGNFQGKIILKTDLSTGIQVYSLNSNRGERSPMVRLALTPAERPERPLPYFEMIGLLDRQDSGWKRQEKQVGSISAKIMEMALAEVEARILSQGYRTIVSIGSKQRELSSTQALILRRVINSDQS